MHASVNPKLSVMVSTSLAKVVEVETCSENPCRGLEALVDSDEALFLWPAGIALAGWAVAALPTFCLGGRRKAEGMRSCMGVLALLWASMEWRAAGHRRSRRRSTSAGRRSPGPKSPPRGDSQSRS